MKNIIINQILQFMKIERIGKCAITINEKYKRIVFSSGTKNPRIREFVDNFKNINSNNETFSCFIIGNRVEFMTNSCLDVEQIAEIQSNNLMVQFLN